MYFLFAFDIVGLKFKKLDHVLLIIQQFMIKYQQFSII